jgi:hypothetical protein
MRIVHFEKAGVPELRRMTARAGMALPSAKAAFQALCPN